MRAFALPAVLLLATALTGCGSVLPSADLLSDTSRGPAGAGRARGITVAATVALGPITGAPKLASDRMVRMLDAASRRAGLALLNYDGAEGDFRLQGDLNAARQRNQIKVTYSWQVLDAKGVPVGGISGTETVPGTSADAWSNVTEPILRVIAEQGIAAVKRQAKPGTATASRASARVTLANSSLSSSEENSARGFISTMQPVWSDGQTDIDTDEALRLVNDYRQSKGLR